MFLIGLKKDCFDRRTADRNSISSEANKNRKKKHQTVELPPFCMAAMFKLIKPSSFHSRGSANQIAQRAAV